MVRTGENPVVRRWRVTVNHSDEEPERVIYEVHGRLQQIQPGTHGVRLLVYQIERGEEAGRLHIQAYLEFSRAVRRSHLTRVFGRVVDSRTCDAGRQANIGYVTKEDTRVDGPWTIGEAGQQGRRSDLLRVQAMVAEGAPLLDIWEAEFPSMVRYAPAIERYRFFRNQERASDQPLVVNVYWGETGTGKSRRARFEAAQVGGGLFCPDIPDRPGGSKWFDGYHGQRCILLDDYSGEYGCNWFKRFLDRYAIQLPVKGGFVMRECTHVFITSNKNPDDWYPEASQADRDALRRRYSFVCRHVNTWYPPQDDSDNESVTL